MAGLRISIITVCWNCVDAIAPTMKSIFDQTYDDIECVVIDGGSTDGTREYLASVGDKLGVYISEPDRGIYDAMNKGIHAATGDYIIFMNAGDRFASPEVVEGIMTNSEVVEHRPAIISGRVQYALRGELLDVYRPRSKGREGLGLPHQATFIRSDCQKNNLFNAQFRYTGDYELWRRLRHLGFFDVKYIANVIAIFSLEGASTAIKNDTRRYLERAYVDYLYSGEFGLNDWLKMVGKIVARMLLYRIFGFYWFFSILRMLKRYGLTSGNQGAG